MKKLIFLFLFLFLFLEPVSAFDTITSAQNDIKTSLSSFKPIFEKAGMNLFYSLALIEIVISTGFMAVRGELEMGAVFANLVKLMIIFGFFYAILSSFGGLGFQALFSGFQGMNTGSGGNLDDLGETTLGVWASFGQLPSNFFDGLGVTDYFDGSVIPKILEFFLVYGLIAIFLIFITIGIFILGAIALSYWVFALMSAYFGIMWVGLGAFSQTRSYAIHAITNMVRWGLKYVFALIMIGVVVESTKTFQAKMTTMLTKDILTLFSVEPFFIFFVVLLIIVLIVQGLPGWVDSYFTGSGGGAGIGEAAGKMAQAATTMAAVAAAGAGGVAGIKSGANNAISAAKAGGASPLGVGLAGVRAGINGLGSTAKEMGQAAFKGANSRASGSETSLSNTFQGANSKTSGEVKNGSGSNNSNQGNTNDVTSSTGSSSPLGNGLGEANNT